MQELVTVRPGEQRRDPFALHGMHRLRHQVFRHRLGWEVPSQQGLERDEYDDCDPVYILARGPARRVQGCVRLLPTTGPYMLRDTFPELLAGEPAPEDPGVWDASRFAVHRSAAAGSQTVMPHGRPAADLVLAAVDHAIEEGIHHYVAVVSVGFERILRGLGLPVTRFGDGRARRIGKALSVALWIETSLASRQSLLAHNYQRRVA